MDEQIQQEEQPVVSDDTKLQATAVPEDFKGFLKTLLERCEQEDSAVHLANIRKIKKLELYFNNIVDLFWDDSIGEYVIPDWEEKESEGVPPRIINRYRPHAESIIAALSVGVPAVTFYPADADNADDIDIAENYGNLAEILQKQNKAPLLFIKILTILFNHGTVFAYSYFKRDRTFGYYQIEDTTVETDTLHNHTCPVCGYDFGQGEEDPQNTNCPDCNKQVQTEVTPETVTNKVPIQVNKEKGRVLIDPFGALNVKVPYSARAQEHCGYLILKFDQAVSMLRSIFCVKGPNGEEPLVDKIEASTVDTSVEGTVRYPSIYLANTPQNTAVVKCVWYRPWQLALLTESNYEDIAQQLQQKYPDGLYVIYINNEAVEINDENLDDHWTISTDPRSQAIHGEPLGTNLAIIQDVSAEIDELELQTMEHAITEVFVSAGTLDLKKYGDTETKPGQLTPVNKEAGKNLSENFYETKAATLSSEVPAISAKYNNLAEFVTGDFPTVYGGTTPGTSTATEYSKSQNQALQRLGTVWKIASFFWAEIIHKSTREFAQQLDYDEKYTSKSSSGFNTTSVDHMALKQGEVGRCEPEFSEALPMSQQQIKDVLINLLQLKDPMIMAMVTHPENNEIVKKAIGINDFYIPGNKDRIKQFREIGLLLEAQPTSNPNSPAEFEPSIMPEEFDDHRVEMEICAFWLNSSKGQKAKYENSMGYQNVVAHWKAHQMMLMLRTQTPNEAPQGQEPDSSSTRVGG